MADYDAIILAAGLSRRMGDQNKLLLPVQDRPMIRHVAEVYRAAASGTVYVVTGFEAAEITRCLQGLSVQCVFNPDYARGQPTSIATGLRALFGNRPALIGLGDQPFLRSADIIKLLTEYQAAQRDEIAFPVDGDRRGHPIIVPPRMQGRLLQDTRSPGCMRFTRENPDQVLRLPQTARGFFDDIDTPVAYAAMTRSAQSTMS